MSNARFEFSKNWEKELDTSKLNDSVGESIAEEARNRAPVDTGELRDSIDYTVRKNEGKHGVVYVFAGAPHSVPVEKGTYKTPAQPYLRPSIYRRLRF